MSNLFTPGKIWYNPQQLILYLTPQQRHVVCIDPPPASEHPGQRRTNGGPQTTGQMLKVTDRTNQLFSKTGWSFCLNWQMHLDNFLEKTKFNSQTFDLLRIQPRKWGNTVPDLANDLPSSFHWLLHPAPRETLWHVNSPVLTFTPSTSHIYTAVPLPLLRPTDQWLQRSTGRWAKDPHELYKLVHSRPSSIFWVARHLKLIYKGETLRTSLVVQWLRIQLAMQGMRVRFLIRELRSYLRRRY